MDILKKLTIKNLKLNKKRSIMTILGILLSTALICAVAGMGLSAKKTAVEMVKYESGDFHLIFYDVPENGLRYMENNNAFSETCTYQNQGVAIVGKVNYEKKYFDYNMFLSVEAFSKKAFDMLSVHLVNGRLPQNDSEILLSEQFLIGSSTKYSVGDTIKLDLGDRYDMEGNYLEPDEYFQTNEDELYSGKGNADGEKKLKVLEELKNIRTKEYAVVGIIERPINYVQGYNSASYVAITALDESTERTGNYTIAATLKKPKEYQKYLGSLALSYKMMTNRSGKEIKADANISLLQMDGVRTDKISQVLYSMIAIIVTIIIVTSVFVIRNSFSISVQEKTRQYGMLASIGATKKQIRSSVLYEGLILGGIGIPLGILLGITAILVLVKVLNILIGDLLVGKGFIYDFSPVVFIVTILASVITILFSCLIPARRASKIAPVAAIRNNEEIAVNKNKLKSSKLVSKLFGVGGVIADKNLKRSRKKYRTTVISLVVSISVFIGLSSFVQYMKKELDVNMEAKDYNLEVRINDNEADKVSLYRDLASALGLTEYSYGINYFASKGDLSAYYTDYSKAKVDRMTELYLEYEEESNYSLKPNVVALSEEYFEKYAGSLGIKSDLDKAVILCDEVRDDIDLDSFRMVRAYTLEAGDTVKLGIAKPIESFDENIDKEPEYVYFDMKISAVSAKKPRGFEDVTYDSGLIFVSENYFGDKSEELDCYVESMYIMEKDADKTEKALKDLRESNDKYSSLYYHNAEAETRQARNLMLALEIFLYGFIIVITLIGVTNVFNTISTNMALRAREFAMLRSVGMTGKEFNRMIRLESLMYGSKALLFGLPIGALISVLFYKVLGSSMDVGFLFPGKAMLISVFAIFVIVWITMKYSVGKIKKQNIIETIRNENV